MLEQVKQWTTPHPREPDRDISFWSGMLGSNVAYGADALLVSNVQANEMLLDRSYQVAVTRTEMRLLSRYREDDQSYEILQTFPLIADRDAFLAAVRMYAALKGEV